MREPYSFTIRSCPDIIVCLDACFTQKRRRGSGQLDETPYPSTFISRSEIDSMEEYVNHCRSASGASTSHDIGNDGYEGTLKVPASILDGCNESFIAADERRQKASTQFFSDTGLMAMLCRHDRVLWLANMTSAGEKQYYALALIKKLFENIPSNLTVGLLYDIACQLHRSFVKYNFLPRYHNRLFFSLSVFHAYGHQWPCQVIYHPRKCQGFGLSDGEGCERFWSSIRKLIPTLRMSGVRTFSLIHYANFDPLR
jgi:Kyakuja-Dileera-Zisupton transposase